MQTLLNDIKNVLVDLAIKGEFDQCDMTTFDVNKLLPAFKRHEQRLKDEAVIYSMIENHDDESLYNVPMVKLSSALGKY